jgi:hypothetical protein
VRRLVNGYDASLPYFITDNLWFSVGDLALHPNLAAPRCLPCHGPPHGKVQFLLALSFTMFFMSLTNAVLGMRVCPGGIDWLFAQFPFLCACHWHH